MVLPAPKSLRAGRASLVDGYATVDDGEIWLRGVHIPEYTQGTWTNHEPRRPRKLLLNRTEVNRIANKLRESGLTLVPLALYFQDGYAKVEIAVARDARATTSATRSPNANPSGRPTERSVAAARAPTRPATPWPSPRSPAPDQPASRDRRAWR